MLDIYPARENPIAGVNSKMIADKISEKPVTLASKADFPIELERHEFDILITLGAGDIDQLVNPITAYLTEKFKL